MRRLALTCLAYVAVLVVVVSIDRIAFNSQGPWVELGAGALAALSLIAVGAFLVSGLRRHRDGLDRRAVGWTAGAGAALLVAVLLIEVGVQAAQLRAFLGGADVRLTAPVLRALAHPPTAALVDERPGLPGTDSITDDFRIGDLTTVPAFYRNALKQAGWIEDSAGAETVLLNFHKGQFVASIQIDQATGEFYVTVDRLPPASPS